MDTFCQSYLKKIFEIDESIIRLARDVENEIRDIARDIESVREINQYKVIAAMQEHRLSDSHFGGTTGYGYNDRGREVLESVYASVFGTEDALVRHQVVSGTQAIAICLYGNLRPGDELVSITGKPYDTLEEVIGLRGEGAGSLKDFGITYRQLDLLDDGSIDIGNIIKVVSPKTKMVLIQRSRGYEWRPSIRIEDVRKAAEEVKRTNQNAAVLVDNCYGEFTEPEEPAQAGADLVAGSLIKNPGGGLVPAGGYVAGKRELVQNAASADRAWHREGSGSDTWEQQAHVQGLFMAPHVVAESLRGAVFTAALMRRLGFETSPGPAEKRSDIIQAIRFNDPESMTAFCQGIQKGSPVDSFVTPEPWEMPGYDSKVIMAAGAFIQGSSIELSADAPFKPPYIAYMQGGLVYEHVKLGVMTALKYMKERKLAEF